MISVGPGDAGGNALFLDDAGRITVAGFSSNGTDYDCTLVRLNPDGTLDPFFGAGGKVVTPIGATDDIGNAIAAQPDGKIVVAGVTYGNALLGNVSRQSSGRYTLVRYLSDGTLDDTYGTGGKLTIDFDPGNNEIALALALDADANALVAGDAGQLFGVARVLAGPLASPTPAPSSTPTPTSFTDAGSHAHSGATRASGQYLNPFTRRDGR